MANRKKQVYDFICEYIEENGISPTIREICAKVNLKSTSTVHLYIKALINEGLLEESCGQKRALRLANRKKVSYAPILGRVSAGIPITAVENYEGFLPVEDMDGEIYALRIKGDSMINAGILDNDIVIIRRDVVCKDNDIVVAMIDDEATCKRYKVSKNSVYLMPENENYSPIYSDKIDILGKVIGLSRTY